MLDIERKARPACGMRKIHPFIFAEVTRKFCRQPFAAEKRCAEKTETRPMKCLPRYQAFAHSGLPADRSGFIFMQIASRLPA
jgi:hypothetical protein